MRTESKKAASFTSKGALFAVAAVAAGAALWTMPLPIPVQAKHALAVSAGVLLLWIGRPFPHAFAGMIGCYGFWALAGVPFATAFSGFANPSAWFVFAAGLFGAMTVKTRLARRLAGWMIGRTGVSYPRLVLGFILTSFLLNFLVPSGIARVIILAGVALGVVKSAGWGPEALPARGLFVILTVSSSLFDKLMITGGTSILAQGIIEKVGQTPVYWSRWLFAHVPTIALSILACWGIVLWLFPARGETRRPFKVIRTGLGREPWSPAEKRWTMFLCAAAALWATDSIHHIPPAMVALGVAFAALLPRIGVMDVRELKEFDFFPFLFSASALSLGETLMKTGALDVVARAAGTWQPAAGGFLPSAAALYGTGLVYHLLVPSDPTTVATSLPAVMNLALAQGWSPLSVGLTWMLALTSKFFVYQSSVSIAGFSFGYFRPRDFLKVGLCVAICEFAVLVLLVAWYWPLIGLIP